MLKFSARHTPAKARVAVLTMVSFLSSTVAPLIADPAQTTAPKPATQGTTTTAKPATTTTAARPAATPAPVIAPDGEWPKAYITASGAALVVYQPQVASWVDQKHAVFYNAISYTAKGATKPSLGTVKVESDTRVAVEERLVSFSELKVDSPNFPSVSREDLKVIVSELVATVPLGDRVIALDRVLANIDTSLIIPKNVAGVKADPPPIFFSKKPAVLVNIDGDPIWAPIPEIDLTTAVNTNWDLFQHVPTKTFYLRNDTMWLKATDLKGPWGPAGTLPESFKKLPADENWKEVKASLPGKKVSASQVPTVFVSTTPAELILLKGEPSYVAVQGAPQLLWVSNSESDIFRMGLKGSVYFLVAGRWFSAPDFTGPWTFATPNLPADFKKIPLEHARSRVLASVPGTSQAAEAVLLAQIPQTATVSKKLAAPEVVYQGGTPEFQPIQTTTVQRAVNTDKDILKVGDLYYMCFQGVWFMSKTATGPWEVTGNVPKEIYTIPVSSPSYNVTYVTVVEDNSDEVAFATAMAFTGMMVAFGCVVWGSGYYYPPYHGFYGGYPYYYPHYPTYGYHASYNPWTGAYTRGVSAYGPYGGAGMAQRYNPRTGTYSRGAVAYGPYGARGAASAYNPRTGTSAATRQGAGVYGSWGATGVARGDQWATTARATNNITGNTTRVTQTSGGGTAVSNSGPNGGTVARTGSGDVYAGNDGNVYRKQGDSYQKYGDGGWSNVDAPTGANRPANTGTTANRPATTGTGTAATRPATTGTTATRPSGWDSSTASQVQRDAGARAEGAQRTRDAGSVRSGTTSRPQSYRPSGGGGGGGGRRR